MDGYLKKIVADFIIHLIIVYHLLRTRSRPFNALRRNKQVGMHCRRLCI